MPRHRKRGQSQPAEIRQNQREEEAPSAVETTEDLGNGDWVATLTKYGPFYIWLLAACISRSPFLTSIVLLLYLWGIHYFFPAMRLAKAETDEQESWSLGYFLSRLCGHIWYCNPKTIAPSCGKGFYAMHAKGETVDVSAGCGKCGLCLLAKPGGWDHPPPSAGISDAERINLEFSADLPPDTVIDQILVDVIMESDWRREDKLVMMLLEMKHRKWKIVDGSATRATTRPDPKSNNSSPTAAEAQLPSGCTIARDCGRGCYAMHAKGTAVNRSAGCGQCSMCLLAMPGGWDVPPANATSDVERLNRQFGVGLSPLVRINQSLVDDLMTGRNGVMMQWDRLVMALLEIKYRGLQVSRTPPTGIAKPNPNPAPVSGETKRSTPSTNSVPSSVTGPPRPDPSPSRPEPAAAAQRPSGSLHDVIPIEHDCGRGFYAMLFKGVEVDASAGCGNCGLCLLAKPGGWDVPPDHGMSDAEYLSLSMMFLFPMGIPRGTEVNQEFVDHLMMQTHGQFKKDSQLVMTLLGMKYRDRKYAIRFDISSF